MKVEVKSYDSDVLKSATSKRNSTKFEKRTICSHLCSPWAVTWNQLFALYICTCPTESWLASTHLLEYRKR